MARTLYSVTMSLDCFIAGPDGDMSWMTPYLGPNPDVDQPSAESAPCLSGAGLSAAMTRTEARRRRASRSEAAGTALSSC